MSSLYLHIPFCEHKCLYCDFYSIESLDPMEGFLKSLEREIILYKDYQSSFDTIFFGGGTPSLLSPDQINNILGLLSSTFAIDPQSEITLETNPGTVDRAKLEGFRAAGINRLSFGVQSFFDDDLRFLTRIHSSQQAEECIKLARQSGFGNINLDLIFALPNQTMERWMQNLRRAVELKTEHISAYSLIVEPNTPLFRMVQAKQVSPLPLDTEAAMYEKTMALLADAGYEHYEVSNYAFPGYRSRHNSNYWNHTNYLGFGPSAHSFWNGRRWWNIANLRTYLERLEHNQLPVAGDEHLNTTELLEEAIMLGLRAEGIHLGHFLERFGIDLRQADPTTLELLVNEDLAVLRHNHLRLTDKGFLLCDEISQRVLSSLQLPTTTS